MISPNDVLLFFCFRDLLQCVIPSHLQVLRETDRYGAAADGLKKLSDA
jgi:hypothetical protein